MDEYEKQGGLLFDNDPLNHDAYYAILGFSPSKVSACDALIKLLRSDQPIKRIVRDELAHALEGTSYYGVRLNIEGADHLRRLTKAHEDCRRNMKIGDWITAKRADYKSRKETIEAAADKFRLSADTCDKALQYRDKVEAWMQQNAEPGTLYGAMTRDRRAEFYHTRAAEGEVPPPNRDKEQYERDQWDVMRRLLADATGTTL